MKMLTYQYISMLEALTKNISKVQKLDFYFFSE